MTGAADMSLSMLERWYATQCNGDWEHGYGVKIDTLDNPGWHVRIDLSGTKKQDSLLERVVIARSETDWMQYWVEKKQFQIACGPTNLSEAVEIFVRWFDSN
jgi:hypothetical protein